MMCGYLIQRTEHPKLFIVENHKGLILPARNEISTENLDIFSYVNSKFVYVERHIRTQLSRLYHDITLQTCNVERQVLKTLITLAPLTPDEFAYQLMKGPGYMALIVGEVAHIIKCIPVEVTVRHTSECYHQLAVKKGNECNDAKYVPVGKSLVLVFS